MSEENNKELRYYSGKTILEKIDQILNDTSLTEEERKNPLEKLRSMLKNEKLIVGFPLKNMFLAGEYKRSKERGENDQKTKGRLDAASRYFDQLVAELEMAVHKEQIEFFSKYPEYLPVERDIEEWKKRLDPSWTNFKDYYIQKLNDELTKNKYVERGMEKWKKFVMVQYAKHKFHEIYRKGGDLTEKEEETKKFYKKLPKDFKKFLKILPQR